MISWLRALMVPLIILDHLVFGLVPQTQHTATDYLTAPELGISGKLSSPSSMLIITNRLYSVVISAKGVQNCCNAVLDMFLVWVLVRS